jgi:outer membrane protein OmpA-like peptidoglycan-associated protein
MTITKLNLGEEATMLRMPIWPIGLVLMLALSGLPLTTSANAQTSKDEIVRSLTPKGGLTRSIRTRKIEVIPGKEAEVLDNNKNLPKINLTIEFEYDSEQPTANGELQLAALGEALRDPRLKGYRFLLAGHTDARGSDDYNQRLSERRAQAVQNYLVGSVRLDGNQLKIVGFGERRLLDPNQPDSPRNRRVEVINLLN